MMNKLILAFLTLSILSACYYDNEEDLYGLACDTELVTYAAQVNKIITQSCATAGCHNGSTQLPAYQNYAAVLADTGKIFEQVIVQKSMPPGNPLSDCDFKQLQSWIQQGAKE